MTYPVSCMQLCVVADAWAAGWLGACALPAGGEERHSERWGPQGPLRQAPVLRWAGA